MTLSEIITIVASILSILISSGALVALFQIRSNNAKTAAETIKLKAEADQIKAQDQLNAFNAQISAAKVLSDTYTSSLSVLNERISSYETREVSKEDEINKLEGNVEEGKLDRASLRRKIDSNDRLFNRLVGVVRVYLAHHADLLTKGIPEDPSFIKKLEEDLDEIALEYKDLN